MGQSTSAPLQETEADENASTTMSTPPTDDADIKDIVMIEKPNAPVSSPEPASACGGDIGAMPAGTRLARSESVPVDGTPIATQGELDAALASISQPANVTNLTLLFSHESPIADATLLNKHGLIRDDVADPYDDYAKNAFSLGALSAFTSLSVLSVDMDDGCCHPVFLTVPRAAWSRLSCVEGDWATFRITD